MFEMPLFHFHSVQIPAQEVALFTFRVGLLTSVNLIINNPSQTAHRHCGSVFVRLLSQVILGFVKLKINQDWSSNPRCPPVSACPPLGLQESAAVSSFVKEM